MTKIGEGKFNFTRLITSSPLIEWRWFPDRINSEGKGKWGWRRRY